MFMYVLPVLDELVRKCLQNFVHLAFESGNSTNGIHGKLKTVHVIEDDHIKRRSRRALLFVSADVQIPMVRPSICQPMNEPWISVISKDDGSIRSKDLIEILIGEAVRMLARRLERHYVHDIDKTDSQI